MPNRLKLASWFLGFVLCMLSVVDTAEGQHLSSSPPPYIPTPFGLVEEMLDIAAVGPGDIVYDLGSGDGRIVIEAAARGARGVGIEYEEWLVALSRANADSAGVASEVRFEHGDIFDTDLYDASVVMIYLGPEFNMRLRPRFLEQLSPGARVVSHAFHMEDWVPDATRTLGSGASLATLHLWIVPARIDGFWSLAIEDELPMSLEIRQNFQFFDGEVRGVDRVYEVEGGAIQGESIDFELVSDETGSVTRLLFTGRWADGRLTGSVRGPWGERAWQATRFTDQNAR